MLLWPFAMTLIWYWYYSVLTLSHQHRLPHPAAIPSCVWEAAEYATVKEIRQPTGSDKRYG